jgi:hypothetical protein
MLLTVALISAMTVAPADTIPAAAADTAPAAPVMAPVMGPIAQPVGIAAHTPLVDDTIPRRRKAIEISDAYAVRLKIHYIASYAALPLFAAQAIVGEQLYHSEQNGYKPSESLRVTHDAIAVTLGALFVTNSVTGAWNWWETRHQEKGRTWRTVHGALMLLADAGFATTASLGTNARFYAGGGNPARDLHRTWAEASAGVALASYIMMWKPFRRD